MASSYLLETAIVKDAPGGLHPLLDHSYRLTSFRRLLERGIAEEQIAWFPVALVGLCTYLNTHPSGRAWAGGRGRHLYIITLEGADLG